MRHLKNWFPALALLVILSLVPSIASAQGAQECSQAPNCAEIQLDDENQSGTYSVPTYITLVTLKAGQTRIDVNPANGNYNDGCYSVEFSASQPDGQIDTVAFSKIGGEECQDLSHVEVWWYVAPTAITLKTFTTTDSYSPPYWLLGVAIVLLIIGIALRRRWIKKGWLK